MTAPRRAVAWLDIAPWVVRRRRWVMAAWAAVALALVPFAREVAARLQVEGGAAEESQSAWVDQALATRFGSRFATYAVLVADGIQATDSLGAAALRMISDTLALAPNVTRVLSYADVRDSVFVGGNGTFLLIGLTRQPARTSGVIVGLRATTARLEKSLQARFPGATLAWTGSAAFDYDVRLTSAEDAAAAERRVLPVTLVLLAVVFGSLVAALLPVAAGALSIALSLGAAVLLSRYWPLTVLLQNVVSMIGLALGIDYALLMVTRFREAMSRGAASEAAAIEAARHAGHTVLVSGTAVALGFAALMIVPAAELRSIAIGGLLVVSASVLVATTLLPGMLASLGGGLERGRLGKAGRRESSLRRWRSWGKWVARHPFAVLVVAGAPLAALAWQTRRVSTDIPSGSWLPERMESTRGARALQRMGHSGIVQTLRVIVELPPGTYATDDTGWHGVFLLSRRLAEDARVARVRSLPLRLGLEHPNATLISFLAGDTRSAFISKDERLALIELEPNERETAGNLMRYVRELRLLDAATISGIPGARLHVGGLPALNADYQDAIGGSTRRVIALVMGGSFLALLVGFRSVLVAIKAIALNLLSVAAALGASVLVFQDGLGLHLVGLGSPIDGLFPAVPIVVFCVVFGLSMDYEVFLVGRVDELVRAGMSDEDALVEGLARTAGVITSAALVMIIVFVGFAMGNFLVVKILGFALAAAVLIDATVVRMALGPALLQLAGRWNWWPGRR